MNPLFYFLLALTYVLAVTASPGDPVLDIRGDMIYSGSYYVVPRNFGTGGGGLTLAPRGDNQCPLYIGQETSEANRGIPVKFTASRFGLVTESEDLYIEMDVKATTCGQPTFWSVPDLETALFVVAGPQPTNGFFQVKEMEDSLGGYKIVLCIHGDLCVDVGISEDTNGVRRLALSATPYGVAFVKVTGTRTSSNL